ncbi:hypothetical protein [Actinoallomurus iriomotensis]|nr:hypothetical protein [Actinoallomurus iriomotensis]
MTARSLTSTAVRMSPTHRASVASCSSPRDYDEEALALFVELYTRLNAGARELTGEIGAMDD